MDMYIILIVVMVSECIHVNLIKPYTLNIVQFIGHQFHLNKGTKNIKCYERNHAKDVQSLYT